MRLETYDAYVLLEQLLGEAQAELESAGFATRMVMPDTFCRVRVDVPYFKRVLDNLFANVRKYADPAQPVSIAALPENRTAAHLASATPSVPIPARWRATRSACARRKRS